MQPTHLRVRSTSPKGDVVKEISQRRCNKGTKRGAGDDDEWPLPSEYCVPSTILSA